MFIKSVEIEGFWGKHRAKTQIFQNVTIFIGLNGTGKTTFINLIVAALSADIQQLATLQFSLIKIVLVDPKNRNRCRTISVTREEHDEIPFVNIFAYKIGRKGYRLYSDPRESRYRRANNEAIYRMSPDMRKEYLELKRQLANLVEISQISVYRQAANDSPDGDLRQRSTVVDERLQQLFQRFARYQLKLETQLNERSNLFQKEAISSLLYNEEFDDFDIKKLGNISEVDLKTEEDKLSKAFKELGIEGRAKQVKEHISKLRIAIQRLKKSLEEDDLQNIEPDDVFAIPLINRTNRIINLLNSSEDDKRKITEARQRFFDTLHSFMPKKRFSYEPKSGELYFTVDKSNVLIRWIHLSSGEKQLLIQFMEVLLQESRSLIFIADEPELSLHVSWQEKLLKALRELNSHAQLMVATHSPDIVAEFAGNTIDMEDIISPDSTNRFSSPVEVEDIIF